MKTFKYIASVALAFGLMTSCAVHDPFADKMDIGQVLPTVDWEQGSTTVKAGTYASFKAKYYTSAEHSIDHSEVWAMIVRSQTAEATNKLSGLAYKKSISSTDTVRSAQMVASYPHSKAEWDGFEYVLTDSFPTSRTLAPVTWNTPEQWDEDKFNAYFPATFKEEFCAHMVNVLTKDSTYYNDLRTVYLNYDFPVETFERLNAVHGLDMPLDVETDKKSDNWFTTDEVDHFYYDTVIDGKIVSVEINTPDDAPASVDPTKIFPVYKAAKWLFCRYSDNTGGPITTVRHQYMPYFKDLITTVPFEGWIYNSSERSYTVNFSRTYMLEPTFRVYDENGKVGISSDNKEITLN